MEVSPRDGLQNESIFINTIDKIIFISELLQSGLSRIEITSFVNPKIIPQFSDQVELVTQIQQMHKIKNSEFYVLVPNMKGYDRALQLGINKISFVISTSNTHNKKNINQTINESLFQYNKIAHHANKNNIKFRAYISTAFGCPYEGQTSISTLIRIAKKFIKYGACEISISDTIGIGNPIQTYYILNELKKYIPIDKIALHMHDTNKLALANILVALTLGISSFDASAGGLGGCPYTPGASGNIATEDLIYMLNSMNIQTNINTKKLKLATKKIKTILKK